MSPWLAIHIQVHLLVPSIFSDMAPVRASKAQIRRNWTFADLEAHSITIAERDKEQVFGAALKSNHGVIKYRLEDCGFVLLKGKETD